MTVATLTNTAVTAILNASSNQNTNSGDAKWMLGKGGSFYVCRIAAGTAPFKTLAPPALGDEPPRRLRVFLPAAVGLLRCRSRFFNQCCHLARVRKKDCVAARKLNDLRLGPLRHEPLKVWVDHPILFGDHGVARREKN